jgi:hypothetical protein
VSLPELTQTPGSRSRRWDAVILGSGISAMVTAARLGLAGQRVLIVEEEATRTAFAGLREPFFLAGFRDAGILDHCLRELTLSLIDRRSIVEEEISFQLAGNDIRAEVGSAESSANELIAWGICKPDSAHALVRSLLEASDAERKAMLASPLVRLGRRITRSRPGIGIAGSHRRGLPAEAASPAPEVARVLNAQVRSLSNLATTSPGPESQARLLGSALRGGAGFASGPPWLHEILRRRVESVFGEFRTLARKFRLVSVMDQPAIAVDGNSEVWAGRMLIIAAPPTALASALDAKDTPDFLKLARKTRRRLCVHLRVRRRVVPEGMSQRVVLMDESELSGVPEAVATLSIFQRNNDPKWVDVVIRSIEIEGIDHAEQEQRLVERALALMPFHDDRVERIPIRQPVWDDDHWLEDPPHGGCWPGELDLRVNAKQSVYMLDRSWVAGLGLEGDMLLGLRAGELLEKKLR